MSFAQRLVITRKKKGLSQSELADRTQTTAVTIGRYERDEVKPPLEAAARIAQALDCTLDYLAGLSDHLPDAGDMKRISDIRELPDADAAHIMATIDALIRDAKMRKTYRS